MPDQHEQSDLQHNETTRAMARLPGLNIEIAHQRSAEGDAEQVSITLQAVPSFDAFSKYLEALNPFVLWVQLAQMAWFPWLQGTRSGSLSWNAPPSPRELTSDPTAGSANSTRS